MCGGVEGETLTTEIGSSPSEAKVKKMMSKKERKEKKMLSSKDDEHLLLSGVKVAERKVGKCFFCVFKSAFDK
ncbi:hypothetical protein ATANTOWER_023128 [Ataeniobius toweri]|uniref:Uncharacterized protein n=1 Tax=Ataeniobius toweri TaxID=208326 RepID=A0ABU7BAF3_9TELE|nr:hypothetical protein [Ataeniobius toweri]